MNNKNHSYRAKDNTRSIRNFWINLLEWLRLLTLSLTRAREKLSNIMTNHYKYLLLNQTNFKKQTITNKITIMKRSIQILRWSTLSLLLLFFAAQANAQYPQTGDHSVCVGETKLYGVDGLTGTPGSTYQWTLSGGGTVTPGATSNLISILWTTPGTHTLQVVETETATGCVGDPQTINITVNPLPVPTITGPSPICQNASGTYITEPGMTGYTWTVTGGTINSGAGTNSINVTWTGTGTQTITVTYTNTAGCGPTTPTSQTITVNPLPVPTITGPLTICQNASGTYTTEPGMTGYTWTVTGGTINSGAGTNSVNVTWTGTGAQTITVTYTNASGCGPTTPTSETITINTLPVPTIAGPLTICQNASGTYTTEPGMTGYVWTITGGTITSGAGTNTINVNWTGTGAQTLTVTYVNANGCSPTTPTSQTININPVPTPTITGPITACQTVNNSTETYTVTNVPGNTYTWVVSAGGTIISGQGTNSIVVQWNTPGAQTVQVTESVGASGCTATKTLNVTVNPKPVTSPITHN